MCIGVGTTHSEPSGSRRNSPNGRVEFCGDTGSRARVHRAVPELGERVEVGRVEPDAGVRVASGSPSMSSVRSDAGS